MCITGEIVEFTTLAQSTVSQHLKVLREAGLIQGEVEGPATCYCLDEEGVRFLKNRIDAWLPGCCAIDGSMVYYSYDALARYGLIREYENPDGFPAVHYYRLTEDGRQFAQRAVAAWRRRPLIERLAVRLLG
jgi:DNA-binding PadR family transcriptional regulator